MKTVWAISGKTYKQMLEGMARMNMLGQAFMALMFL